MSASAADTDVHQPASFAFSAENAEKARKIIARYPAGRQASAVMPLLDLAQRQAGGWVPRAAMDHVAQVLDMAPIRVYEVATFYFMYNLKPVGKHLVQVCRTTPCWLRGSDGIRKAVEEECSIHLGETSKDGLVTLIEVECLGACANAPMVQINDDFYEDLTPELMKALIRAFKSGQVPKTGSQVGRRCSEPQGGPSTLAATTVGAKPA